MTAGYINCYAEIIRSREEYISIGGDKKYFEALRNLYHVYVKFRELDALENSIDSTIERIGHPHENLEANPIEGTRNILKFKKKCG